VQRALLLDVVVGEGAVILQMLASVDEALLAGGDAFKEIKHASDFIDSRLRLKLKWHGFPS
jgi:hypothetical protein